MRESGLRRRLMPGCLRAGDEAVFGERGADMRRVRAVVGACRVLESGMYQRCVSGRMCSRDEAVLGEWCADVLGGGSVERRGGVLEPGLRRRGMHRCVRAGKDPLREFDGVNICL